MEKHTEEMMEKPKVYKVKFFIDEETKMEALEVMDRENAERSMKEKWRSLSEFFRSIFLEQLQRRYINYRKWKETKTIGVFKRNLNLKYTPGMEVLEEAGEGEPIEFILTELQLRHAKQTMAFENALQDEVVIAATGEKSEIHYDTLVEFIKTAILNDIIDRYGRILKEIYEEEDEIIKEVEK